MWPGTRPIQHKTSILVDYKQRPRSVDPIAFVENSTPVQDRDNVPPRLLTGILPILN